MFSDFFLSFFFFFFCGYFKYLFLPALGLRCCTRTFPGCGRQGLLFPVVQSSALKCLLSLQRTSSRCTGLPSSFYGAGLLTEVPLSLQRTGSRRTGLPSSFCGAGLLTEVPLLSQRTGSRRTGLPGRSVHAQ